MLSIPVILAQLPHNITPRLTADPDGLVPLLKELSGARAAIIVLDERGWVVVLDGVTDPARPSRQAGSRGGWPSMRHAMLAALLIHSRPELPIEGQ